MTNKKYLPSVIVLYLNYFLHGIGCSILGQAVIKDALAASWNVEAMAITAIAAALGLGRLIALPFAGPLSDKLGRRFSTAFGGFAYAVYLIGLAMAFNAGGGTGYRIAYICAIVGGIANSTPSSTQESILLLLRSSTRLLALLQWESSLLSPAHSCFSRSSLESQ